MREQLSKVEGVEEVEVDFASKTATVTVKAGTKPEDVAKGLSGKFSGTVKQ